MVQVPALPSSAVADRAVYGRWPLATVRAATASGGAMIDGLSDDGIELDEPDMETLL